MTALLARLLAPFLVAALVFLVGWWCIRGASLLLLEMLQGVAP